MRRPDIDIRIFKERRDKLASQMPGAALVLPANPEFIRNHDVHHYYRQDSNLYYLTGFTEADSVLVFRPGKTPETVMFVHPKDPLKETWEGFLYGPELTKDCFGVDAAYEISKFEEMATTLLAECDKVYYRLFHDRDFDQIMDRVLKGIYQLRRRANKGIMTIEDSYPLVGEMRLYKSDWEADVMRKSCQITAEAHVEVMKATRPGINERALYGVFMKEIMVRGCEREGYRGIFAGGNNATTLHYVFNDQVLKNNEIFLVDAGGEYNYYSADITRSYPVNGKFNPDQGRLYQKVLDLQKRLVQMVVPGTALSEINKVCIRGLTEIMVDERLLSGSVDELVKNLDYRKYYPHGVGHWLGMDVHDSGATEVRGESRRLEAGMVMTIEPGIYIPADDEAAPKALRGIGIRIEDDVLTTQAAPDVMTKAAPKEIDEMEAIIGLG